MLWTLRYRSAMYYYYYFTLPADFTHSGSITMFPTTSTTCMCSCIGLWVFVSPVLLLHCMYTLSVSSFISLSRWTETSSTLATSVALSRVKYEPVSMSFSRTFWRILCQTRLCLAQCDLQSFTSSFNAVTNCWQVSPGSWILLCSLYLAKTEFDLDCT